MFCTTLALSLQLVADWDLTVCLCAGAAATLLYFAPNYPLLLTGRVTYGLGIGFAMHAAPAYIAETAAASVRGLLIRWLLQFSLLQQRSSILAVFIRDFWKVLTIQ